MVTIESNRIRFIPPEERWEQPHDDNTVRKDRNEYYVHTIARPCDKPNNHQNCGCDGEDMEHSRPLSTIRITRNFETQKFILYVDGEATVEAQWAETPSGRGPNGHKEVLYKVKMFAQGWMAAEEEVPVKDIQIQSDGPKD